MRASGLSLDRVGIGTGRVKLQTELSDAEEASELIAKARAGGIGVGLRRVAIDWRPRR